jgi:hypothetical protein
MMMFLWPDDWRNIRTSGRSARCASCLSFTRTGTVYRTATTEMRPFGRQPAFMPRRADFLVELRGFEPLASAERVSVRVGRSSPSRPQRSFC